MTSLPKFSVDNPVIVNLMMIALIVAGVYSSIALVREMFPESNPNQVLISTIYPGATPSEIDKGISTKIEEVIKGGDRYDPARRISGRRGRNAGRQVRTPIAGDQRFVLW